MTISDETTNQSTNSTSLSYFSIAFPLTKKMAVVFGMQPTSSVGYSLVNTLNDDDGMLKKLLNMLEQETLIEFMEELD